MLFHLQLVVDNIRHLRQNTLFWLSLEKVAYFSPSQLKHIDVTETIYVNLRQNRLIFTSFRLKNEGTTDMQHVTDMLGRR